MLGLETGVLIYISNGLQLEGLATKKPRTTKFPSKLGVSDEQEQLLCNWPAAIQVFFFSFAKEGYLPVLKSNVWLTKVTLLIGNCGWLSRVFVCNIKKDNAI